jgi:hypothetical protein
MEEQGLTANIDNFTELTHFFNDQQVIFTINPSVISAK